MPSLAHSAAFVFWILGQQGLVTTPASPPDPPRAAAVSQAATPAKPATPSQTAAKPGRQYFVSWGYNGDFYSKQDMHFSQPSLGNDFTFVGVQARESKGWDDLFSHALFVPQYNIRIGVFLNEKWGVEMALDHFKWIVKEDQTVHMTGTRNGVAVDTQIALTEDVLRYQLNNGANPIFFNLIRRWRLGGSSGQTGHTSLLAKAGGGFVWPHTENTLFGQDNDKGFQPFHGWNVDVAVAARVHLYKPLYFEFEEKLLYARYYGVKIDQGTAHQSVKNSQYNWNFGLAFGK